jgi:colicin import membrane protein
MDRESERFRPAEAIHARLLTLEARAPEPAAEKAVPEPQSKPPEQKPSAEQQPAASRPEPESAPVEKPEPEPREPEPKPEPEVDTRDDSSWRESVGASFDQALDDEAARLAEERAETATASFVAAIVGRIERNWSRPASARNDMRVELRIGLVPTGEVVSVDIIDSSGNAAFDRSAETAVRRAAPFEVPDDPGLFERQFRSLRILFHPEDLRK